MSKAVIYIDTEDDITAIIDRVKESKSDIVALVPPKRIGVLQSIVNLKLLKRAAASSKKRLVLITNDAALIGLAGGVAIPTAKNLQSRPEIAKIAAAEIDGSDVINGDDLPVGDVNDAMADQKMPAVAPVPMPRPSKGSGFEEAPPISKAVPLAKGKKSLKVPNFIAFRKKLFIFGGLGVLLLIFLWWALFVAPSASIAITARTEIVNIDRPLTLDPGATDEAIDDNTLKPNTQQLKKNKSVEFKATGKKDVGDKASGTAVISNCQSRDPISVPVGTALSANGLNFITATAVEVPGGSSSSDFGGCDTPGRASVKINAQEIGEQYNLAGGTRFAVAGFESSVSGTTSEGTSGGSKEQVSVVSSGDVEAARQKLAEQDDDGARDELLAKFEEGFQPIQESYRTEAGQASASPAVGEEADNATLTVETTYTIMAVAEDQLNTLLDNAIRDEIGDDTQKSIYENGRPELEITEFQALSEGRASMRIKTIGYIGAKIDENQLKQDIAGKRHGEIQDLVKGIPNVDNVEINFSPFWVSNAPSPDKITVEFKVIKDNQE